MGDLEAGGYSGSESYRYVEPILFSREAELLVISPYIGMGYAKKLVKLGKRKRIRVITSKYSEEVRGYIMKHSRYLLYGYAKAAVVIGIGGGVATYFSFYSLAAYAVAASVGVALLGLLNYMVSKSSDIQIRTSYNRFVHEKAYISGATAAVGSANLTYNGLKKNVERVEVITDPKRVASLRSHFFDLWKASA